MTKFATVRSIGTRLRAGMIVEYADEPWEVKFVNDCRAFIRPVNKRDVRLFSGDGDERKEVRFEACRSGISISPNSELKVLDETNCH